MNTSSTIQLTLDPVLARFLVSFASFLLFHFVGITLVLVSNYQFVSRFFRR